ncbi:heme biosynthesis protein HemY [Reinekea blandensis]|uniref:HemY N-terminal domain-containing protein n=1 Tax=Reinekea blandensis MED297 TaxID=314283 RepID=A4BAQ1_9GAMM|nr:heme biosynthesis HemY N-terminal domain-containing protein [Reinekea blandensis]EAR11007.1 hypothetical protein MED297_10866 [Reinekea sp. MED297] [Reinekea blandensis MED297]
MTRLMLWIVLIALTLLLGGVLAQMMVRDSGVMMLTWNGWMVETTFWTGLGLLLTLVILGVVLLALLRKLAPARLLNQLRSRRDQKVAKKETASAIDHWLHGADDRALASLQKVIRAGGSDRLPSAVSLVLGMDQSDWPERYGQLITEDPEMKTYADAIRAWRLVQAAQHQEFIELMEDQFRLRQVPWLREHYWRALMAVGKAERLLTVVNEAAGLQPEKREQWLQEAAQVALKDAAGEPGRSASLLKPLSRKQRTVPGIVRAEIDYLCSVGEFNLAFRRAKSLLQRPDQHEQADILLDMQVDNGEKLGFLEQNPPAQPGPVYCRTAGILNHRQQLWGNAQSWLEQGWKQGDLGAGLALAELYDARQMTAQAAKLYRELAQLQAKKAQEINVG